MEQIIKYIKTNTHNNITMIKERLKKINKELLILELNKKRRKRILIKKFSLQNKLDDV